MSPTANGGRAGRRPPSEPPVDLRIDPRIAERREEVRRDEARRRLRLAGAVVGLVAAVTGGWASTRSALLDIDAVQVHGHVRTSAAEVVGSTGLRPGVAMTDVRAARIAAAVERLPWVERASVRRRWPGTVAVDVTERVPVAVVESPAGGWALADGEGRVLALVAAPEGGLVTVRAARPFGRPGTRVDTTTRAALGVARSLRGPLAGTVSRVTVHPTGEVDLAVPPRTTVRLGPPREVEAKLLALATLTANVDLQHVAVVDVRVPSAPVLARHP